MSAFFPKLTAKSRRFYGAGLGPKTYFWFTRQYAAIRVVHKDLQHHAARRVDSAARRLPLHLRQFLSSFPRILSDALESR